MSTDDARPVPAIDISDGVCAYLQGGLGNQLFILAAAWRQARRLDCPLYVDRSRFIRLDRLEIGYETARPFDLAELDLPGVMLAEDSPWFVNSPRRPVVIRRPGRRSHALRVFREPASGGPRLIDDAVRPGTTLLGYFQSPAYFDDIAADVRALIEGAAITDTDRAEIAAITSDPRITVHLRRGDYMRPEVAAHHGLVSTVYVERALDLVARLTGDRRARVFSDSPDIAANEVGNIDGIEIIDPERLSTLATIIAMSKATGFVMSNSSFSWWASYLLHTRDATAPIVAPRPWLASGDTAATLLPAAWLTLGAN